MINHDYVIFMPSFNLEKYISNLARPNITNHNIRKNYTKKLIKKSKN